MATIAAHAVGSPTSGGSVIFLAVGLLLRAVCRLEAFDDLGLAAFQFGLVLFSGGVVLGVFGHGGLLLLGGRRIGR